ncbi:hypothetical protein SASPL_130851 [Salvia splendens]|uniref:Secreted protein n=1 Tax=Salvia splendens TaxID=180675 RepID=A0A8X8X9V0_SALSN|nr:hypothetical protein SASPL_130851 [Salvia splendens]
MLPCQRCMLVLVMTLFRVSPVMLCFPGRHFVCIELKSMECYLLVRDAMDNTKLECVWLHSDFWEKRTISG